MILALRIEKLGAKLEEIGPLMDAYQRGELSFAERALAWLSETEKELAGLRMKDASELASLRGRIVSVEDTAGDGDKRPRRSAIRRARNVAAHAALERADSLLRSRIENAEERLQGFEDKLCEGMTAAAMSNCIPSRHEYPTYNDWLVGIWRTLNGFPPAKPLCVYLATTLSANDRLYILNRIMQRMIDTGLDTPLPEASEGDD